MWQRLIFFVVTIVLFISRDASAQNFTIPHKEFSIFTVDSVIVEKGTAKQIEVWALRSHQFSKMNVRMVIGSSLPPGLVVNFQPNKGFFDYCQATISVNPLTEPGTYLIIIAGKTLHLTKGVFVKVIVRERTTPLTLSGQARDVKESEKSSLKQETSMTTEDQ